MNIERTARILAAIDKFQADFRLRDWDIDYTPDQTMRQKDSAAQTDIRHHQRSATIRVDDNTPDAQIERVIVHEMAHLMLMDMTDLYNHTLSKAGAAGLGVMDLLAEMIERICEQIAEAVTGVPWEPIGKKNRAKHPGFANRSVSDKPYPQEEAS